MSSVLAGTLSMNYRTLLEKRSAACMTLLVSTSAFRSAEVNIFLLADDFCTPKDKVTHCVEEILNDGDGNGDKNSGDGDSRWGRGRDGD